MVPMTTTGAIALGQVYDFRKARLAVLVIRRIEDALAPSVLQTASIFSHSVESNISGNLML